MTGAIILQIVLIALNAVFASAEIAVISMNDAKLERLAKKGNKQAKRLVALTAQPARFLATIQVAITLAGFLGSAYAVDNFAAPLVQKLLTAGVQIPQSTLHSICVFVITLVIAYFSIVFGELIPKRVAMNKTEQIALSVSAPLSLVSVLFKPLVWLLTASTNGILKLLGIRPEEDETVTEEEIRMMAVKACKAIGGEGYCRVDFFKDRRTGKLYLNEINTIPGFTKYSMFPLLWEAAGVKYPDTVERIIELGYERYYTKNHRETML